MMVPPPGPPLREGSVLPVRGAGVRDLLLPPAGGTGHIAEEAACLREEVRLGQAGFDTLHGSGRLDERSHLPRQVAGETGIDPPHEGLGRVFVEQDDEVFDHAVLAADERVG